MKKSKTMNEFQMFEDYRNTAKLYLHHLYDWFVSTPFVKIPKRIKC